MNLLLIVSGLVVLLVLVMAVYSGRRQKNVGDQNENTTNVATKKGINTPAKPVEKLSKEQSRQWLDDFLVQQQENKKADSSNE